MKLDAKILFGRFAKYGRAQFLRAPLVFISLSILLVSFLVSGADAIRSNRAATVEENVITDQVCIPWQSPTTPNASKLSLVNAADDSAEVVTISYLGKDKTLQPNQRLNQNLSNQNYVRVQSTGTNSQNLVGTILTRFDAEGLRGLAHTDCQSLVTERWFSGIETTSGFQQNLILVNVDQQPVVAKLSAFTEDGAFAITEFERVSIPAESLIEIDLTSVVPGEDAVTLKVVAEQGRLATQIQARKFGVNKSEGFAVNRGIDKPNTRVVIAGAITGSELSKLQVTAAGSDAIVSVQAINSSGAIALAEWDDVLIPAGTSRVTDITSTVGQEPVTFVIQSNHPVIAALSQKVSRQGSLDLEVLSSQDEVTAQSVAVMPESLSKFTLVGYTKAATQLTVNVRLSRELLWSDQIDLEANGFFNWLPSQPVPSSASVHFKTSGPISLTVWVERTIRGVNLSSAMQLKTLSAELVPGARLELVQP
jgi:hypothetical protein